MLKRSVPGELVALRAFAFAAFAFAFAFAAFAPSRASAAALPVEPQLGLVDADAAVYLSIVPDAEAAFFTWARRVTGPRVAPALRRWIDETAAAYVHRMGFDGTTSWAESGLQTNVPILVSLFAVDAEATEKAFRARAERPGDAKRQAKAPRVWNRSRLVALIADEAKLRKALATFAGSGPEMVLTSGPAAGLAAVFRADARQGKAIAAALKGAKVLAVARASTPWGHDVLVFVRVQDRRFLVVDALWAFGGVAVDWKKDGAPLLKLVTRKLKQNGAQAIDVRAQPGSAFAGATVGIYVKPERLLDLGKFIGWSKVLAGAAGVPDAAQARSVLDTGEREVAACEDFRPIATEGPMTELVLAATPTPAGTGFTVDVYWPLRTPGVLDAAFATSDDGLVDLAAASGVKLLALLPLAGTEGLRKLPLPAVLQQERRAIDERARLCGFAASANLLLLAWPQYLTRGLDGDASLMEVFRGLRNVALAVKRFGPRAGDTQAMLVGSVAQPMFHDYLDRVLKRSKATTGKRKLEVWKSGRPADPWAVAAPSADGKRTIYGLAWGGDAALSWWWGQPSPASPGGATPFVALARTELPWFAQHVLEPELGWTGAGELAANLGGLKAVLTLAPQLLWLHTTIEVK